MNQDHRETIGGIAAAATGNLVVVLAICIGAALVCNIGAIWQWGFQ